MKEVKRVKYEGYELRLVNKPRVTKIGGRRYHYRWIVQVRSPGMFRFQDHFILNSKKEGLRYLLKDTDNVLMAFRVASESLGVVNKLVGGERR